MAADDHKVTVMTLAKLKKSGEAEVVLRHWKELTVPQDCDLIQGC